MIGEMVQIVDAAGSTVSHLGDFHPVELKEGDGFLTSDGWHVAPLEDGGSICLPVWLAWPTGSKEPDSSSNWWSQLEIIGEKKIQYDVSIGMVRYVDTDTPEPENKRLELGQLRKNPYQAWALEYVLSMFFYEKIFAEAMKANLHEEWIYSYPKTIESLVGRFASWRPILHRIREKKPTYNDIFNLLGMEAEITILYRWWGYQFLKALVKYSSLEDDLEYEALAMRGAYRDAIEYGLRNTEIRHSGADYDWGKLPFRARVDAYFDWCSDSYSFAIDRCYQWRKGEQWVKQTPPYYMRGL